MIGPTGNHLPAPHIAVTRCGMISPRWQVLAVAVSLCAGLNLAGAESMMDNLMKQGRAAHAKGQYDEALAFFSQAVKLDPAYPPAYYVRGRLLEEKGNYDRAVEDFTQVIRLDPKAPEPWQQRGVTHFRMGKFQESIRDFDKAISFRPDSEPHHWQRGIAYYYAGEFAKGRKQFESHQTVNPNDVENAVWHFLCVARLEGVEKARAALIPIEGDRRVPMMKVQALFAGKAKPEDVLAEIKTGEPAAGELRIREFYSHLYLGLYYDALKDAAKTKEHIFKAEALAGKGEYMGDVAKVHAAELRKEGKKVGMTKDK